MCILFFFFLSKHRYAAQFVTINIFFFLFPDLNVCVLSNFDLRIRNKQMLYLTPNWKWIFFIQSYSSYF